MAVENTKLVKLQTEFSDWVKALQTSITSEMHRIDPSLQLIEDNWQRKDFVGNPGGGGRTRAFHGGKVFENAGVNISQIHGQVAPEFAKSIAGTGPSLWACGISLILHPWNPRVPTVHANYRMIVAGGNETDPHNPEKIWFGGGADLTPFYPHTDDFYHFHQTHREASPSLETYRKMKTTCDEYFVNHHRQGEMRGIGGIFFDHHNSGHLEDDFAMVTKLGKSFIPSYFSIVTNRMNEEYTQADVDFQLYRRGRYVEFNLLHDRGTHFGLKSQGRTESILISLPARCQFGYCYSPPKGSKHEEMMQYYFPHSWERS
jgi:coproporphyrinogen III oxidase